MNIVTTGFQQLNYVHAASTLKPAGEASTEHLEDSPNVFRVYVHIDKHTQKHTA